MKHKYFIAYLDKVDKMIDGCRSLPELRRKMAIYDGMERVRILRELSQNSKKTKNT